MRLLESDDRRRVGHAVRKTRRLGSHGEPRRKDWRGERDLSKGGLSSPDDRKFQTQYPSPPGNSDLCIPFRCPSQVETPPAVVLCKKGTQEMFLLAAFFLHTPYV